MHTLKEIIDFNNRNHEKALKYGQKNLIQAEYETSGTLTESAYIRDRINDLRLSQKEGIDKVIDENKLDVLLKIAYAFEQATKARVMPASVS